MEFFLPISYLNDFIFCPYSIYLHQVYDNGASENYSAIPQANGKAAHPVIDFSSNKSSKVFKGIYVISNKLGVYGKIDSYYTEQKKLVESKYKIDELYKGYFYQLWAQYFALTEMGFEIDSLQFYSIKHKKTHEVPLPAEKEFLELKSHIRIIARFDFESPIKINPNKCSHCIYAALCDKTEEDHVYA